MAQRCPEAVTDFVIPHANLLDCFLFNRELNINRREVKTTKSASRFKT
jgi:hypothetical protein